MDRPCKRSNDCGKAPTWIWCVPSSIWTGFRKKNAASDFLSGWEPAYAALWAAFFFTATTHHCICGALRKCFARISLRFLQSIQYCCQNVPHLGVPFARKLLLPNDVACLNLRRQGTGTCRPRPRRRGSGSHPRRSAGCPGRNPSQNPSSAGQNRPACSGWWCRWP